MDTGADDLDEPLAVRLGRRIRALRKHRGLTVVQLATLAGTGKGSISRTERGLIDSRGSSLEKIAAALGVEVEEFFGRDPEHPSKPTSPAVNSSNASALLPPKGDSHG